MSVRLTSIHFPAFGCRLDGSLWGSPYTHRPSRLIRWKQGFNKTTFRDRLPFSLRVDTD